MAPASTLFTAPPHWRWLIILYFFIGGIAGGAYFLATLLDLFGRRSDRRLASLGYYVTLPAVVVSGLLLTLDLGRPLRFWHMLLQSERLVPMFKAWSPMSIGAWALLVFGGFSLLSFVGTLADAGWPRSPALARLRPPGLLGGVVSIVGALLGFFVAGYTGVLLAVTNRPIWSDTSFLGVTFLISAASTAAATLLLLAWLGREAAPGIRALQRFDAIVLVLELIALVALVVSLGSLARLWLDAWGLLLLLGVVGTGILLPLALHARARAVGALAIPLAAVLVLIGGFVLRMVIVLSAEGV